MKINSRCKICRREGKKLFLKGERCYTPKCPLVKRKYPPGFHGPKGYPRLSDFGRQLREKQRLRHSYNLSEKQIKNYFVKAKASLGNTEKKFLASLEKRLDNVVYRAGWASSRRKARQMVSHGNVLVNKRRLNVPSYEVKTGDEIQTKDKKKIMKEIKEEMNKTKSEDTLPSWLSLDKKNYQIKVLQDPREEDLPQDYLMELIIGYYSR